MDILRWLLELIFSFAANIYKIHNNWFVEIIFVILYVVFIVLTVLLFFEYRDWAKYKLLLKDKTKQLFSGKKKINKGTSIFIYSVLAFLTLLNFTRIIITGCIAFSDAKLKDFYFDIDQLENHTLNVEIYDQDGNQIQTVINDKENREYVSLSEMPNHLERAFIDVEDKDFLQHSGFSILGYVRAVYYKVLKPNQRLQGGSTITQQLIKNVNGDITSSTRTVLTKYQELSLSMIVERKYDKKEILELYLNRIFLGSGTLYGVGVASEHYFNKHVSDLTLAESAFLAGLPQAPSRYTSDLKLGNERKDIVLNSMKENGSITEGQSDKARQENITLEQKSERDYTFDSYIDYVLKEAKEVYGIKEEDLKHNGYQIHTYMDSNFQRHIYNTTQAFPFADDKEGENGKVQASIAAIDLNTSGLIALYGGRDYMLGYRNRVYDRFQPGSIIKPLIVYAPAFETGDWELASTVKDELKSFGKYKPRNAGDVYEGDISIERAITRSANVPAVSLLEDIGTKEGLETLKEMDIPFKKNDQKLTVALGGMEKGVTPIEMAQAYTVFPNLGSYKKSRAIKFIKDDKGEFLEDKNDLKKEAKSIFSPKTAYQMNQALQKVVTEGTGRSADVSGLQIAGKTGTTEQEGTVGNRDSWFVGYTPNVSMAIHLGFDIPNKTHYLTTSGGQEPSKLFAQIVQKAPNKTKEFAMPTDIKVSTKLTKVTNLKIEIDEKNKNVILKWDKNSSLIGVSYEVYRKIGDKKAELIATVQENTFQDGNFPIKQEETKKEEIKSELLKEKDSWITVTVKFIDEKVTAVTEFFDKEKRTYYITAILNGEKAKPSEEISAKVPKLKTKETNNQEVKTQPN